MSNSFSEGFYFNRDVSSIYERVPVSLDYTYDITRFGNNNLYPQLMNQIMLRSSLVKSAVRVTADFLTGDGFETNGQAQANELGHTFNQVLDLACYDMAEYMGFALHLRFDGEGTPIEVNHIPFKYVRFGIPDQRGVYTNVAVSNNWEQNSRKLPQGGTIDPQYYDLYNPMTAQENGALGGNGQVIYYTGRNMFQYPKVSFDAIINHARTDDEIGRYMINSTASGFTGQTILKWPGKIESEEEKRKVMAIGNNMTGSRGPGLTVMENFDLEGDTAPVIESIPSSNEPDLYNATIEAVQNAVLQNYAMPAALLGVQAGGSVFNEQGLVDGYTIYNARTRNLRKAVSEVFNSFGNFGEIKEQTLFPEGEEIQEEVVAPAVEEEIEETVEEETPIEAIYGKNKVA